MRQGQEAVPRDGNDSALVLSLVERHHEVDRCLARTDQDYVIAVREGSEHPLSPRIPHVPPALKSHPVLDERMTRREVAQRENYPVHDKRFLGLHVDRGAPSFRLDVCYLSAHVLEQRAVRSGLPRLARQVDDVVSEKPAREKVRPARARAPSLGPTSGSALDPPRRPPSVQPGRSGAGSLHHWSRQVPCSGYLRDRSFLC